MANYPKLGTGSVGKAVEALKKKKLDGTAYNTGTTSTTATTVTTPTTPTQSPLTLDTHLSQKPGSFSWEGQTQLDDYKNQYLNREDFTYDYDNDPLYQQYKQQYLNLGQQAMQDTMGQAAALTGGYGNSYAQTAGQQAYQGYLQQLNAVMPELYGAAYDRYMAEGDALYDRIALLDTQRQQAYGEYQDENADWYNYAQLLTQAQDTQYNKLMNLLPTGYTPTDEELAAAGMTQSQAQALTDYYNSQNTATATPSGSTDSDTRSYNYDTHGYTIEDIKALQTAAGITADGIWGPDTEQAYQNGFTKDSLEKIQNYVPDVHSEEEHGPSYIFAFGPYSAYVIHTILTDPSLSKGEKDALTEKYGATEADYKWLASKGILPEE